MEFGDLSDAFHPLPSILTPFQRAAPHTRVGGSLCNPITEVRAGDHIKLRITQVLLIWYPKCWTRGILAGVFKSLFLKKAF